MTKKALKEAYKEWNREITKLDSRKDEIFETLKDMCEKDGDGNRWCCIQMLVEKLTKTGNGFKAMQLMGEYYEIEGQHKALMNFAKATNNFEI